jgi:hypothetical protein
MATKTEVYSWRVSPALKAGLEEAARRKGRSLARLLDEIVEGYLARGERGSRSAEDQQRRLHESAERFAGSITGKRSGRSVNARQLVRARLQRLRGAR